jgi:RNA polymerase sigma factor (sigma-70 family)
MESLTLWKNFKEGDRQAFDMLLRQYYPLLLNYGARLVADRTFVEDCLQDFFIDLWNKRAGLGDAKVLNAYLISSFRRRLFREKEKTNRLKIVTDVTDDYDFDVQFDIESDIISKETDNETSLKLKQHLDSLSKRQREAIYLRFYQSLEYPDIAEIMTINHHSAVNLIYDALKILRKNWVVPLIYWLFVIGY